MIQQLQWYEVYIVLWSFMTSVKEVTPETMEIYHVWRLEKTESLKVNKSCSVTKLCLTFCDPIDCSMPGLSVPHHLPEFAQIMSIELVVPPNHLILCHPLPLLPSIFPIIRVFSNESDLNIRWTKYWSFSFSISPSSGYLGLISFRIDWFEFLPVQGTLKSLLQHHISKASILQCSAFSVVQCSHPYMTSGKSIVLTIWIFNGKVMSLPFSTLSRFVIAFLPKSNHLISWLQSPFTVIWTSHCSN